MAANHFVPIAFMLLAFTASPALSADLTGKTEGNLCKVEGNLDTRTKVSVTMESSPGTKLSAEAQEELDQYPGWRRERYKGWSSLVRASFTINGVPVVIPQSALEDIYGVQGIRISRKQGTIILWVSGGDGGESYSAAFKVMPSRRMKGHFQIVERVWRQGEFSSEVFEKTTYHNTIWDDPNM